MTVGADTYVHDLLSLCGGENGARHDSQNSDNVANRFHHLLVERSSDQIDRDDRFIRVVARDEQFGRSRSERGREKRDLERSLARRS